MPDKTFVMDLAKLVIAAGWADGELSTDEINALKDTLFSLTELGGQEWQRLQIYMDSPVSPQETERLLDSVVQGVRSNADKHLVMKALTKLVEADGQVDPAEKELLKAAQQALEAKGTGLLGRLTSIMNGVLKKRRESSGVNREDRFDDYVHNPVYFELLTKLEADKCEVDPDEASLRKLCLAAGLMARIGKADLDVSEAEQKMIEQFLQEEWRLTRKDAQQVAAAACSRAVKGLDLQRTLRSYYECSTRPEHLALLRSLFQIANAAEKTSLAEIESIRDIARMLRLSHKDFIEAKLTIPREDRNGL